jgi:H/ACA ribonucleoprotein complex subunit 2
MGKPEKESKKKSKKTEEKTAAKPAKDVEAASDDETEKFNPANLSPIAHPLAGKKLYKKILKTVKKGAISSILFDCQASKEKHVKRGVKEVVKALRKNEQGFVFPYI